MKGMSEVKERKRRGSIVWFQSRDVCSWCVVGEQHLADTDMFQNRKTINIEEKFGSGKIGSSEAT